MDEWNDPVCSPGRPRTDKPLANVSIRLPRQLLSEIDAQAASEGLNRSQFFRKAVMSYISSKED